MTRQIEITILVALLALAVAAGWMLNGWRLGTKLEKVSGELKLARAQGLVLAESVKACNAGVELARQAGEEGRKLGQRLLAEARRLNAPDVATAAALEALLERPEKPGATCDDAWREIEERYRKAGAP